MLDSGDLKSYTRSILSEYAVEPKKQYGQNYVIKKALINKILLAAQIDPNDIIVEVGGGIGTLTYYLVKNAKFVHSYEIDPLLTSILKKEFFTFSNQLEIIFGDFLKKKIVPHHKLVSNLPYAISSPFIWKLSNMDVPPELVVVTMQKEFAEHLCANPGSTNYSRLSVFSSYFFKFEKIEEFPPHFFFPRPRVTSCLVRGIKIDPPSIVKEKQFFLFLTSLFCRKHKKSRNNLLIYQKKISSSQRRNFRAKLDDIPLSSQQPINLTPDQILSLYSDFDRMIRENYENIDFYELKE